MALYREGMIVGHVPHNLAPSLSAFLRSKGFAQVTGNKISGLEVPCVYCLYRPKVYIDKMKELVDTLTAAGHL